MRIRPALFVALVALCMTSGCNSFSSTYSGAAFSKTADARVDYLNDANIEAYKLDDYRVIGSATFENRETDPEKIKGKAREAAMKKGADVVLIDYRYIGDREVRREVLSHYETERHYDKDKNEWYENMRPQYTTETEILPYYRYRGVFLKKNF